MQKVQFYFATSQEAERAAEVIDAVPGGESYSVLRVWNHIELWRVDGNMLTPSDLIKIGEMMIRQSWKKAS